MHAAWILSMRVSPFGYPRINGYLLLPEAFRSLSRPSSAPDAKAFPLRSFQLDLSPFSQRLVREFLVLFENYAGFTKIEIVCHPASFRMLFHIQFASSCFRMMPLCCLTCFVTLFSFQGAELQLLLKPDRNIQVPLNASIQSQLWWRLAGSNR